MAVSQSNRCRRLAALFALCCLSLAAVAADQLSATVDRTQLAGGETLRLTLTYDAQVVFGEPDFAALDKDFEVLSSSRQSQFSIVNGRNQSSTAWHLTLSPKRAGQLVIPSFNFKGAVSDAIEVTVVDATAAGSSGADKPLYAETLIDKDTAYVQEQVLLTLRLYSAEPTENLTVDPPDIATAIVKEVGKSQYQKAINGRTYLVSEIRFAIFAETSGELRIPPAHFTGIVADLSDPFGNPFFNRGGRSLAVNSDEKTLRVKPRPAEATTGDWLPSTEVSLNERWSNSASTLVVGEPVTRTITITARGLTAAQLPPLPALAANDLQTYPDQPQLDDKTSDQGVTGQRIESTAIVPTTAGTLSIPPTRIQWWDITTDQVRETTLAGRTFTVIAATNTTTGTTAAGTPSAANPVATDNTSAAATPPVEADTNLEPRLSHPLVLALIIGNALSLLVAGVFATLWWRRRQHSTGSPPSTPRQSGNTGDEGARFKAIRQAAANGEFAGLRAAILGWAAQHWPDAGIRRLRDVALMADSEALGGDLTALFAALDSRLYRPGDSSALNADALIKSLETLRRQPVGKGRRPPDLLPLYPDSGQGRITP